MRTWPCCPPRPFSWIRRTALPEIDSLGRPPVRPASRWHRAALEGQERALRIEAARVAPERAVGREDAVAGHDDRDRVRPERLTGGSHGLLAAGPCRDLGIRRHVAVRHAWRRTENPSLEIGQRREIDRHIEALALAG